jgi:hypothetical protein
MWRQAFLPADGDALDRQAGTPAETPAATLRFVTLCIERRHDDGIIMLFAPNPPLRSANPPLAFPEYYT